MQLAPLWLRTRSIRHFENTIFDFASSQTLMNLFDEMISSSVYVFYLESFQTVLKASLHHTASCVHSQVRYTVASRAGLERAVHRPRRPLFGDSHGSSFLRRGKQRYARLFSSLRITSFSSQSVECGPLRLCSSGSARTFAQVGEEERKVLLRKAYLRWFAELASEMWPVELAFAALWNSRSSGKLRLHFVFNRCLSFTNRLPRSWAGILQRRAPEKTKKEKEEARQASR